MFCLPPRKVINNNEVFLRVQTCNSNQKTSFPRMQPFYCSIWHFNGLMFPKSYKIFFNSLVFKFMHDWAELFHSNSLQSSTGMCPQYLVMSYKAPKIGGLWGETVKMRPGPFSTIKNHFLLKAKVMNTERRPTICSPSSAIMLSP